MKKTFLYISLVALMASCGGNGNNDSNSNNSAPQKTGTKFAPKERVSSLSEEERTAAIDRKRSELADEINVDSLIHSHGVKFSVLPPAMGQNLPEAASYKLATRMIQIASQNGIGGLCTNPVLAMVSRVDCLERSLTASTPQKALVTFEVTCYCGNFATNDIYGSSSQKVSGVGSTFEDAANNAMNEFKNTAELQKMIATASDRAISWYSTTGNVQSIVDKAVGEKNYGLAMVLLSSVPEQAKATYEYAVKKNAEVSEIYFQDKAAEFLAAMEGAIAEGGDDYNPQVGAYLQLISPRSSSYTRAKQLYDDYIKRLQTVRDDIRDKEHRLEMERLAVEKIKAPYEAQISIAQINADAQIGVAQANAEGKKNANTGGFLGLGKMWDGVFGLVNKLFN